MKGIILAGGTGTRLYPLTLTVNKQLMPVYKSRDLLSSVGSDLMLAGIREILVISIPGSLPLFQQLFGDGSQWGLQFSYIEQPYLGGVAEAFILGCSFLHGEPAFLVLGDNIFYGDGLGGLLLQAARLQQVALIFGYQVTNPQHYGVIEFDQGGRVLGFEEKPQFPKSPYVIPGIYFYDSQVCDLAATLTPSVRGELEITDLNRCYLEQGELQVELLSQGYAWLDTGTHESLHQASSFIQTLEERQGLKIAYVEEIAYQKGYISGEQLYRLAKPLTKSDYGTYLMQLIDDNSYYPIPAKVPALGTV
ncbi:MAG: glucose-1-phosphate thymidylyltransferase RfbA [Nodosilinea sp. WJT8-NPBG4]|nr:glucose-1-phosphate thymidylyltransferase RfbA [Nodosilinea sp. WJT8-NPBG4]